MYVAPNCCCAGGRKWSEDVLRGRVLERPAQRWRGRRWCREQKEQSSALQMRSVWHTENGRFARFILSTRDRPWRICRYCQGSTSWHPGTSLKGWTELPDSIFRPQEEIVMSLWDRTPVSLTPPDAVVQVWEENGKETICPVFRSMSWHSKERTQTQSVYHATVKAAMQKIGSFHFSSSLSVKWVCIMGFQRHGSL